MNEKFTQYFQEQGFKEPTLIQKEVYPLLQAGKNVLGLAPTGSGKTLAYALPLLEKLLPKDGPQLLIIAPSQELAAQIAAVIRPWGKLLELNTQALIGGANVKRQIEKLKQRPEVIVGTPGRLLNLVEAKKLKLHNLEAIVIDEADELLSQEETREDCRKLVSCAKADVNLSFFSATKTRVLDELHRWFGIEVAVCDVRQQDHTRGVVDHYLVEVPQRKRVEALRKLAQVDGFYALVFFKQSAELKDTYEKLVHHQVPVARLASDQRQVERQKALTSLKKRTVRLVLTTDVACRGLDIEKLPAVVNFDLPRDVNTYIHRVGRTGRMGEKGLVVNLGNEHDLRKFKQLAAGENFDFKPGFIYNKQLVADKAQAQMDQPERKVKKQAPKVQNEPVPKAKKHKKKRQRDQKNKGKRKVKKS